MKHAQWAAGRLEVETADEYGEMGTSAVAMPIHDSPWAAAHDPGDVANYAEFLRGLASGIADILDHPDGKLADSILSGARESALTNFDITTRANKITSKTTFRFSELKDKGQTTSVSIMLDPNKIVAQSKVLGVLNWCMLQELKRRPDASRKPYILVDEAGNIPWPNLEVDLTTLRVYAVLILAFQNFPAFAKQQGKSTLETLQSEAQVKLFMPGQRNPETLSMIERMLGQESIVVRSNNSNKSSGAFSMDGYGLQEIGKPLMSTDEIRRCKKAILIIGNNRPVLVDLPSIAAIAPFKYWLSPSPFYGKPYRKWTKLRMKPYPRSLLSWLGGGLKFVLTGGRAS